MGLADNLNVGPKLCTLSSWSVPGVLSASAMVEADGFGLACLLCAQCRSSSLLEGGSGDGSLRAARARLPSGSGAVATSSLKACWHGSHCPWHARGCCLWGHDSPSPCERSMGEAPPDAALAASLSVLEAQVASDSARVRDLYAEVQRYDEMFAKAFVAELVDFGNLVEIRGSKLQALLKDAVTTLNKDLTAFQEQLAELRGKVEFLGSPRGLVRVVVVPPLAPLGGVPRSRCTANGDPVAARAPPFIEQGDSSVLELLSSAVGGNEADKVLLHPWLEEIG